MVVIAYKLGAVAFDDKSLIKALILPSLAKDNVPVTFHDAGVDYEVPGGKIFLVGRAMWAISSTPWYGRVGESDIADGAITKEVIILSPSPVVTAWIYDDVIGIYTAGKFVTAETNSNTFYVLKEATLYGVEIDA